MPKKLMKGCNAIAEAAILGGCRFFAGYPITPQSEIPEYLAEHLPEVGGTFIQGESEVASINMVYGAAACGVRAMTSSSGPGISLKAEGISYLAGAMLPAVIVDVTRGGPGLGCIQPAQQDYLQATKALGHGGFRTMVFVPHTVQEAVDLMYDTFDYAERDRNPVVLLLDGCLASVMEEVEFPAAKELPAQHPEWAVGNFDGTPRARRTVSSLAGKEAMEQRNIRNGELFDSWEKNDVRVEKYMLEDAEYVIVAYGMSARVCKYAIQQLRAEGIKIGMIRPITLVPFPKAALDELDYNQVKAIIDVEMSLPAQMRDDIALQVKDRVPILTYGRSGGVTLMNEETTEALKNMIGGMNK